MSRSLSLGHHPPPVPPKGLVGCRHHPPRPLINKTELQPPRPVEEHSVQFLQQRQSRMGSLPRKGQLSQPIARPPPGRAPSPRPHPSRWDPSPGVTEQ